MNPQASGDTFVAPAEPFSPWTPQSVSPELSPIPLPPLVRSARAVAVPIADLPALRSLYGSRLATRTRDQLEGLGATTETERAVARALVWLARHQSADGRWDVDEFVENYSFSGKRAHGGGTATKEDAGVTGIALLAFLGAGHTHRERPGGDSNYRSLVANGLAWLLAGQTQAGDLGRGGDMFSQCLGTIALLEAFAMTGDESLREPARAAVEFIARTEDASPDRSATANATGGPVLGWHTTALMSAQAAGIAVPRGAFERAAAWLDTVRSGWDGGLYAFQPGQRPTASSTAEGLSVDLFLAFDPESARTAESAAYLLRNLPRWNPGGGNDLSSWHHAAVALHHLGGAPWQEWNAAMRPALVRSQRTDEPYIGSWDPNATRDGSQRGRVHTTALAALTLETYYRYVPFHRLVGPAPAARERQKTSAAESPPPR